MTQKMEYLSSWNTLDQKMKDGQMMSKLKGRMKNKFGIKNDKTFQQLDQYLEVLVSSEQHLKSNGVKDITEVTELEQANKENSQITANNHKSKTITSQKVVKDFSGAKSSCQRCKETVYATERVEPNKGLILHKHCFKCQDCGLKLTLNTFYSNQVNLKDMHVYCKSHAPRNTSKSPINFNQDLQREETTQSKELEIKEKEYQLRKKPSYLANNLIKSEVIGLRYF